MHRELVKSAALQVTFDYSDPAVVRRQMCRNIAIAEAAGVWMRNDVAVDWSDTVVPDTQVKVRVYNPKVALDSNPAIVFLHGGAFVVGDLDIEHPRCLEMCRRTNAIVVSIDYRLAPEHPFPAAIEDCAQVLDWLFQFGVSWRIDPTRVAIVGCSAGGGLAAGLTLMRRDQSKLLPCLQLLIYPVLDDRMTTASMQTSISTPVWNRYNSEHMWRHYLGESSKMYAVSPYAAPARAPSLAGLPRCHIFSAEHDPLRDEAINYAQRLMSDDVPVGIYQLPGTYHGFDTLSDSVISRRAREEQYAVLIDAFHASDCVESSCRYPLRQSQ